MKKLTLAAALALSAVLMSGLFVGTVPAEDEPAEKRFDQTDGVLARARVVEDIEYTIMVQRATQAAIYYMPAVGMVDFVKGIRRDLGGGRRVCIRMRG